LLGLLGERLLLRRLLLRLLPGADERQLHLLRRLLARRLPRERRLLLLHLLRRLELLLRVRLLLGVGRLPGERLLRRDVDRRRGDRRLRHLRRHRRELPGTGLRRHGMARLLRHQLAGGAGSGPGTGARAARTASIRAPGSRTPSTWTRGART
jgi:hypothetical protein